MQDTNNTGVTAPQGFLAGAVACGIKEGSDRPDLAMLLSTVPAAAAAVFTRNRAAAAPVLLSRNRMAGHRARAIVVNSGNANACTGSLGLENAVKTAAAAARRFGLPETDVLVLSTGVIGVPLPIDRLLSGIERLAPVADGGQSFAGAIMTTDTCRKEGVVELNVDGSPVRIGGAAKGSGMIHPNMATLLGFLATDAAVDPAFLQTSLNAAVEVSFNAISVDGDTSTNDAVVVLANGVSGSPLINETHPSAAAFAGALTRLCVDLARQLARDGEGARTLIEVQVEGAATDADARRLARAIAASNLVKTAVFGGDPNWGRVICAAGYAGVPFEADRAALHLNDLCLFEHGLGAPFPAEEAASALRQTDVTFRLSVGLGNGRAVAWGCDLSYEYVRINAEYTT